MGVKKGRLQGNCLAVLIGGNGSWVRVIPEDPDRILFIYTDKLWQFVAAGEPGWIFHRYLSPIHSDGCSTIWQP